jgi:integrase
MAREKGMGNLQQEKSGRWTMRVCINGKRYSRSTRTTDKAKAERFLQKFLAPLGLGERRLPLGDVWLEYIKSPDRRDLAQTTLNSKRLVWMDFARWMECNHLEVANLGEVTHEAITEYLACIRASVCASTYNGRICVLREIFRVLADKAGLENDPWDGVHLHADDSHSRRELTLDEVTRLIAAAGKMGDDWRLLFIIGIYTGLRLGDCCRLAWNSINVERGVIQLIPNKTKKHSHGHPVTIPIHPVLLEYLSRIPADERIDFVIPEIAEWYKSSKWKVSYGLERIFKNANIVTSVKIEGRRTKTPEATFHSLRHTFVSLAANAGVPLPIVQSIVGHSSTAMTRHYYHENLEALSKAIAAIPVMGPTHMKRALIAHPPSQPSGGTVMKSDFIESRLKKLVRLAEKGLISPDEFSTHRARILNEV